MGNRLTFLHLSDIHFDAASGQVLDLNRDLRNQLQRDVKNELKPLVGTFDGVLVTGDIAYSGKTIEYERAKNWLDELCEMIGCGEHQVWVVPGNHDVERNKVSNSKPLRDVHERLRKTLITKLDNEVVLTLRDETYKSVLFNPIDNYIKFAEKYECKVLPEKPFWESSGMKLNDGSLLCFWGLTSIIVSDDLDDVNTGKLVLGSPQVQIPNDDFSKTYVTLCHHPPDWLHDRDNVLPYLNSRARVALFGHKHKEWIVLQQVEGNSTLFIVAGAVHPERNSGWQPRYNALSFEIVVKETARSLKAHVYSRVWDRKLTSFQADRTSEGKEYREFTIPLQSWVPPQIKNDLDTEVGKMVNESCQGTMMQTERVNSSKHSQTIGSREFTYKFLSLPFHVIVSIGVNLGLIQDEDERATEGDLVRRFYERAQTQGKLQDLISIVISKYNKQKGEK
jgi:predicted MPP superfamily phosphohydrolase